jgi:hypothetical protein
VSSRAPIGLGGDEPSAEELKTDPRSMLAIVTCQYHRALARAHSRDARDREIWRAEARRLLEVVGRLNRLLPEGSDSDDPPEDLGGA